jgi:hypothetical protein
MNYQQHNLTTPHPIKKMDSIHGAVLSRPQLFRLAYNTTYHCFISCGIGEIAGLIIATVIGLDILSAIILSVALGFIAGVMFSVIPLMKEGFNLRNAIKAVIIGEGLSISAMETFEVMTELAIPGVMTAHITDSIFWIGLVAALVVSFIGTFPINYILIKKGIRHQH